MRALLFVCLVTGCSDSGGADGDGDGDGDGDDDVIIEPTYPKDGFCNEGGSWAWCEDFDGQGTNGPATFDATNAGIAYHAHDGGLLTGVACESTLEEGGTCDPFVQGGSLFLNAEDGGFGMAVARIEQPFDFAGREGHIHFVTDLRAHPRMHQALFVAPMLNDTLPDLRTNENGERLGPAIGVDFVGGLSVTAWNNGSVTQDFYEDLPTEFANEQVRRSGTLYDVDIYVSRTSIRVLVQQQVIADYEIEDLGFDRGYVYLSQLAYNPVKDHSPGEGFNTVGDAANTFQYDNIAFDGPALAKNSTVSVDQRTLLFRAYNKSSCTVRGVAAEHTPLTPAWAGYDTWRLVLDASAPAVTTSDIRCVHADNEAPGAEGDQPEIGEIREYMVGQ